MKNIIALMLLMLLYFTACTQQTPQFVIHNISLPKELEFYDNQFSGLYIQDNRLFMMSESRLEDNAEAKLYAVNLQELEHKLADTSYRLAYTKYPIYNLEILRNKIAAAGDTYEGLEAMLIHNNTVYFSVETTTPSSNCYLIKGILNEASVSIDTNILVTMAKPLAANGSHIYNAGFEALAEKDNHLFAFFEYNYFDTINNVYVFDEKGLNNNTKPAIKSFAKLPFRITDITSEAGNYFTAINYFFSGGDDDTVYRVPVTDTSYKLIKDSSGFKNYCRLIDVAQIHNGFSWKPLWVFPEAYSKYNWEGIAAYKKGCFIINDKYTPKRPYKSTLLYLERKDE